jgi:hypothetical protein
MSTPSGRELHCTACLSPVTAESATCPNCGIQHPSQVLARGGLWVVALVLCVIWAAAFLIVAGAG